MDYKIQALNGFQLYSDQIISVFRSLYENDTITLDKLAEVTGFNRRKSRILLNFIADLGLSEKRTLTKTKLGNIIFEEDGFLQDEGTLWLFHYLIASNEYIVVWNRILNELAEMGRFSLEDLYPLFNDLSDNISEYSFKKHIHQEVRTTIAAYTQNLFKKLGLIEEDYDKKYIVSRNIDIDEAIILAAIYEYRERFCKGSTALPILSLVSSTNGVARVFAMDEHIFREKLENIKNLGWIEIESRGNLDQIRLNDGNKIDKIMETYYQNRRK